MNKKMIQEAFDLLKDALEADDNDQATLKWTASLRDLKVLRSICRADISVPKVLSECYPGVVTTYEVRRVLHSIGVAIDGITS